MAVKNGNAGPKLHIGVYGRKAVFWPLLVNGTSQKEIIVMMGIFGPQQNFFLLTVCTLHQY